MLTINTISEPSKKGYVTIGVKKTSKLGVNFMNLLTTPEQVKEEKLAIGDDITDLVGAYTVRTSKYVNENSGLEQESHWIVPQA